MDLVANPLANAVFDRVPVGEGTQWNTARGRRAESLAGLAHLGLALHVDGVPQIDPRVLKQAALLGTEGCRARQSLGKGNLVMSG